MGLVRPARLPLRRRYQHGDRRVSRRNVAAAGLQNADAERTIAFCEELFGKYLDGHGLMSNARHLANPWLRFPQISNERWSLGTRVLLGDAAHTAHFSIGSGTKLALEDAIALARELARGGPLGEAYANYEAERRVEVLRLQNAARNSLEWFENVSRYANLEPEQFAYSLLTRSQRIGHENLRLRDAEYVESVERWFARAAATARAASACRRCSRRSACARSTWSIAWSFRRWPCTRARTDCPTTSTSCTWARGRRGARGWSSPR